MRLLYLSRSCSGHDRRFLDAFQRHGLEASLVTLQAPARSCGAEPAGTRHIGSLGVQANASTGELRRAIPLLGSMARQFQPDIVIAGPIHDCAYLAYEADLGLPIVTQSWAFDVFWENMRDPEAAVRTEQILRRTESLFADCRAVLARCEALAGRPFRRHFVMPWGLEDARTPPAQANDVPRFGVPPAKGPVFLHTRALEPVYAVDVLAKAFAGLLKRAPDALLDLASDGSLRPWLEEFIAANNLGRSIRLLGALPHQSVLELYGEAAIYVSCSASDGTSISLLEAMRAGVPPIVNDRGGNPEWVTDRENGWVVPFGDADSLSAAMLEATLAPPARLARMAGLGKSIVRSRADWGANFPQYVRFLGGCVEGRPPSPA